MTGNVLKYVVKMLVNLSLNVLKNEGSYIKKSVVGNKMSEISHMNRQQNWMSMTAEVVLY